MRNGLFGFSLILWRSRRRPGCRCLKSLMFNIFTFVRVAPATTDVHIILEVPATDKIHIEDRYGLAEQSQTTRKTVN